ncbi:MAG: hypothetical protein UE783_03265, partial [Prevotella sp.]|nr:hypothetical protein [Prevotella sp.]
TSGTDCSDSMVPITPLRLVPIQRYRHFKEADYNCEYDVSKDDFESMQQPAHDFLTEIERLIAKK